MSSPTVENNLKNTESLERFSSFELANLIISIALSNRDRLRYAIFAIEQAIIFYEKKYLEDSRLRESLTMSKEILENNNKGDDEIYSREIYDIADKISGDDQMNSAIAYTVYDIACAVRGSKYFSLLTIKTLAYASVNIASQSFRDHKKDFEFLKYGINLIKKHE